MIILKGALTGFAAAFVVDLNEFRRWRKWDDLYGFDWRIAVIRWAIGAASRAVAAAGLGSV